MKSDPSEILPLVDEKGNLIGSATRSECHSGSKLLHPVVHLHVISRNGSILLQKRSMDKDIQPGKWDTAVGGHFDCGENPVQALVREAAEELGIDALQAEFVERYVFESKVEKELVHIFFLHAEPEELDVKFAEDEIDAVRFWDMEELQAVTGHGFLTPNFEQELQRILPLISKQH